MPTQLQLRRGTTNQHNTFTGVVGEVTINTTKKTAVVHDGSTAGGLELLRADMSNVFASATPTITSLNTSGDVSVGGNLTVTGTTTFNGGTITMGDADTDNVVFGADVNSNILPNTDNTYALGSSSKKWSDVRSVLLTTTGNATIGGDVAVNGGDLTTSQTTFNLLNTTATTLNVGGAATTLEIGAATGTTNINNNLDVDGDVNIDGGDLTVSTTTFNLANTTATTLNVGGAATSLNLGAGTGTTTVNNNLTVTGNLTVSGTTTTVDSTTINVQNAFVFEGATADGFETTLTTVDPTADRTLSLPDATDTLVGRATTDTLSNKTFTLAQSGGTSAYATKRVLQYNEGTGVITYSNKLDAVSPYITGYGSEIHVSPVALDNTGNGTIGDPVKTIAKALELAALAFETTTAGSRKTIILHPGDYAENVTLDTQYIVLTTHEAIGKNTTLSGTLTISKGCTVNGLKMTNLIISATSATGSVDIINCTVTTATTKTSSAYTNFRLCDLSSSTLSITGAGSVVLNGGNYGTVTVNNASAAVLAKAVITMAPVTLTAGTLQIADTVIYSATNTSNAITQSAGSFLTLNNCQTLIPDLTNVARNSFGGYYSILHSVYDKANSTFGGTSLSAVSYSQYVNADRLTLNGSTSGATIINATAAAGTTTLTLPAATDTLVGKATTDTLTNKTINLTSNTLSGTTAQFNTALSDDNFATLAGTETLTNKTLTTPVISSISNSGTITIPTGTDTLVGRATTDTLTNKTLTSPVISTITNTGTLTLPTSTDTLVGRATTDTLTNKTIGAATISGNLIPNADATIDLGSGGQKWATLNVVNITQTGNTTTSGTLQVTGTTALNGGLTLDVDKFTVADGTGNTLIGGTLGVTGNTTLSGDLSVHGGDLTTDATTFNLLNTTATTINIGGVATTIGIGANSGTTTVNNNLTIAGDLTVSGNTTTLNTATLEVEDKNIIIAKVASPTDSTADGAGITIKGATDKTFNWVDATDAFTSSEHIETAAGKTLALSGSSSGKTTLNVSAAASGTLTLPAATDTLVGKATSDTLTNKSISLTTNTITGTTAEFNTALSDDNFVTLTGTETLTNKTLTTPVMSSVSNSGTITIPTGTDTLVGRATTDTLTNKTLTSPVISSISNTGTLTLPTSTDTLVGKATTDVLTNKSISLTTNTITGTISEFNSAVSDANLATIDGVETLTNKTLSSPVITTITTTSNSSISLDPNGTGVVNVPAGYTGRAGFGVNSLVPKSYVDALEAGLHVHQAVKAATTDTLAVLTGGTVTYDNGTAGVGATLTLQNALTTLDTSYTVVSGDRLLIKNQANAAHNGIYTIDATRTILTRATDFDSVSEIASGDFLFVANGTQFGNQGYVQTVVMVTVGSTSISFTQFSGAGQITAGNGLTKDGNTIDAVGTADRITVNANSIDIASTYAGQSTITTLGTISSGTWQGSAIAGQYGGTGVNNSGKTLTLGGNFTHTGAHTLGLTTTANTSITLPTTGTLATLNGSETLANKTLTSPIISSISNTGTLTLPTSTDTLVGRATTDTLTNKTLTSPVISSISNTGTLTLPTSTDTLVGRATTDTLTNKTIGAATISGNLIPNANATVDLGSASNKFRHLYLDGSSFFMGTTKVSMHANGYFVFNNNSASGYPSGSNVSVATATNGVGGGGGASTATVAALAIALGGA